MVTLGFHLRLFVLSISKLLIISQELIHKHKRTYRIKNEYFKARERDSYMEKEDLLQELRFLRSAMASASRGR